MYDEQIRLSFSQPFGVREEYEAEARGYFGHAQVELPDGVIPVVFYDPVRLQQDLEETTKAGRPFIAEPGMIVVECVTMANMKAAVQRLHVEKFFDSFRRAKMPSPR